jgi:hypothetical protein
MGLFSKKKDLPFPSQLGMNTEEVDFDKLIAEIPQPPSDFSGAGAQPATMSSLSPPDIQQITAPLPPGMTQPQKPEPSMQAQEKELPPLDTSPSPKKIEEAAKPAIKEAFELPDFDEDDMKDLENIKPFMKEEMPKEPEQPPVKDFNEFKEFKEVKEVKKISYPALERPLILSKEKFLDLNNYALIKEDLEDIKGRAASTCEMIEQHALMSKEKNDKHHALSENLNMVQEKLIIIDTKLFESL